MKTAAELYCSDNNFVYELIDVETKLNKIIEHENKIKFMDKYKEKYNEYKKVNSGEWFTGQR